MVMLGKQYRAEQGGASVGLMQAVGKLDDTIKWFCGSQHRVRFPSSNNIVQCILDRSDQIRRRCIRLDSSRLD